MTDAAREGRPHGAWIPAAVIAAIIGGAATLCASMNRRQPRSSSSAGWR